MKKIYCLLFVYIGFVSNAQQASVQGLLKDSATNEPVISASIGVKNTAAGTISNEEGNFQLTVSKPSVLLISCLGYKAVQISAADFSETIKTILLEPSEEALEEVMVTKIPLYQMLSEAIATSIARLNKPILLHTYYREFAKSNGKYSRFSDGILDYHIGGNTKKTTSDLVVVQNRSANLTSPGEEEEDLGSILSVQKAVSSHYSMNFLFKNIIEDQNYEDYDFQLKSKKEAGNELFIISFDPKTEVEKGLFKGTVTYDPQTKLIQEVDVHSAPSHFQYAKTINLLIARVSFLESKLKVAYKMVGNNYVLSYNNRFWKIRIFNKKNSELLESRSDLIVTNFEKDVPFDKKLRFKKKHLHEKPTSYTSKFWKENNAIVLTSEEEKIISDLEKSSVSTVPMN